MKSHPILVGFLVLATCAGMAYAVWDRTHPLRTPEETESAFLKNYTPKSVMEHFDAEKGTAVSSHSGGGSGRESVSHQSGFQAFFAIKTGGVSGLLHSEALWKPMRRRKAAFHGNS